jgi:carbonic anhydrase
MVEVAQTDINIFKLIFPMNARPAQKVNRRFVLKGLI